MFFLSKIKKILDSTQEDEKSVITTGELFHKGEININDDKESLKSK